MEFWKDIKSYEGYYQVSNLGNVKRIYKNGKIKILKPRINHKGYARVTLCRNKKDHKEYFEKIAREKYGYCKPGEKVYYKSSFGE